MNENYLPKILSILRTFPGDYSKAAEETNLTRKAVIELLAKNPQDEQEINDAYLDKLNAAYKNWIIGKTTEGIENFSAPHALKVLERERPEDWASTTEDREKALLSKGGKKAKQKKAFMPEPVAPIPNVVVPPPLLDNAIPSTDFSIEEQDLEEELEGKKLSLEDIVAEIDFSKYLNRTEEELI